MRERSRKRPDLDQLKSGIDQCDRTLVARAITLIESKRPEDQRLAGNLLDMVLPKTGRSIRIGITGVPGVGKSTFIEALGTFLTDIGKKVAVLSIDPSSTRTGGSILGDKTRMAQLSRNPNAYIRPSPSGKSLGGVAQKTRESILICEAAGFDVILVETVGVGQSETAVKDMVDFFLLLMLAGGGDELQGIKRGIMEMADGLVINKADGKNLAAAKQARKAYLNALHLFPPHPAGWQVPVQLCSALQNEGIAACWETIAAYQEKAIEAGYFAHQRKEQNLKWMHALIRERLEESFFLQNNIRGKIEELSESVAAGELSVRHAVAQLFSEK
ncbi:methylmalonyl Co-A mutase-associated GTPase MeaB [Marinoscillum furvescens]|uniref:Methylmalonyl-CoA mutase metallochaperone MeaB n=1 Tax=Marinoscillum furvescens DSM 4134 TaxID=1122208 RepID=A0A3D9L3K9_MARFU|nr:methylmalonyl Co-A mutase-associated GTPase MeaB [Marinoscillum furvescens]RED99390.1 methylmalonyl-CoA mutase metallochaperone MeaB [Marinoscillum furvescens DSM 4134]